MAFQISGIIQHIGNTESIPYQGKVFKKRELVLDCSYRNQFTGQIERTNYPKFEFTGNHVDEHLHKGHAKAHNKQLWSLQEQHQLLISLQP